MRNALCNLPVCFVRRPLPGARNFKSGGDSPVIPLRDEIPSRTVPLVNYGMIGLCTFVFLAQVLGSASRDEAAGDRSFADTILERFGMIPARVLDPERPVHVVERVAVRTPQGWMPLERTRPAEPPPFAPWLTLLTCIFLHGGWLHFLGNMWFLHIFGDNVEDRIGHLGYLLFYLGCGVAASATHLFTNADSTVPTIGASGAIAGVMGGYMVLYPHARVLTLVPIFIFIEIMVLPAYVFLGIWFLLQFFQGTLAVAGTEASGVAWWAHIGGFAAGLLAVMLLRNLHALRPPPRRDQRLLRSDGHRHGGF